MHADKFAHRPPIPQGHDVGDGLHAKGGGQLLIRIDIDFDELKAAIELGGQLLQERAQLTARLAPRRPEIDDDRPLRREARITSVSNRSVVPSMIQGEVAGTRISVCFQSVYGIDPAEETECAPATGSQGEHPHCIIGAPSLVIARQLLRTTGRPRTIAARRSDGRRAGFPGASLRAKVRLESSPSAGRCNSKAN